MKNQMLVTCCQPCVFVNMFGSIKTSVVFACVEGFQIYFGLRAFLRTHTCLHLALQLSSLVSLRLPHRPRLRYDPKQRPQPLEAMAREPSTWWELTGPIRSEFFRKTFNHFSSHRNRCSSSKSQAYSLRHWQAKNVGARIACFV